MLAIMFRFTKLFLVLIFATTSLSAQTGRDRKSKRSTLKTVKEHLRFEEYNQAIPGIRALLQRDSGSAQYNFWMGKCLYITYKKNQALPHFEKVDQIDPQVDQEFHYYYGLCLHHNLKYDKAIAEYQTDLIRYEIGSPAYNGVSNRISQCLYAKNQTQAKGSEQVKVENMGPDINTEYAEHSPVISANDSVLLYTARRPESIGADPEKFFYDEDIYISHRKNGKWSPGENINKPINSKGHDATISLAADGQKLYLYRHKKAGGLYVTDFDNSGKKWREPRAVDKPLNSKYFESSICQSADSTILLFTSDRPGGYGGQDIYMVKREGSDKWSEPQNLGANVNSPFDEDAPYFHPDGKTLYYSSNGPNSMGGFDIFVTEMDSTDPTGWLAPLNMGSPINTPDDDIYFVLSADGKNGYYSSGKEGGYGEKDIYHLQFPYYPYPRRYNIIELAGTVQDLQTLDTLQAMVTLIDSETQEVLDSVLTGSDSIAYSFILEPERSYSLIVKADGYVLKEEEVRTPGLSNEDVLLKRNLFIDKPDEVISVVEEPIQESKTALPEIQHLYYNFDDDQLREGSSEELDLVALVLERNKDLSINILSHTDWYGSHNYNTDLSRRRALRAKDYLVEQKGISVDRISTAHFSENSPLESNESDEGRQFNRRTEFQFIQNGVIQFSSVKLKTGIEELVVDYTAPRGPAGFDKPNGTNNSIRIPLRKGTLVTHVNHGSEAIALAEEAKESNETEFVDLELNHESNETEFADLDLSHVYFDFDRFNIRSEYFNELNKILKILQNDPEILIGIHGHTDNYGSIHYNQQLAVNRAQEVFEYLLNQGANKAQLIMNSFGEAKPMDTNQSRQGRRNNRRVEFQLLKNGKTIYTSQP